MTCLHTETYYDAQGPRVGEYCKHCAAWVRWVIHSVSADAAYKPIHFGRYKGTAYRNLPRNYLYWLANGTDGHSAAVAQLILRDSKNL